MLGMDTLPVGPTMSDVQAPQGLPMQPQSLPRMGAQPQQGQAPQGLRQAPPAIGATVNGYTYLGGDPRSKDPSVWRPASGDTFLNSLPITDQQKTLVKSIATYDLPPGSQRGGLGSPEVQQLLALAKQYDPNFSASDYAVRQATRTDFAKGKYSQTVNALNTAIDHANLLATDGKALNNTSLPILNWIKNTASSAVGDPRQTNFNQVARYLGGEVTKATTGGQGGEQDRQDATGDYQLNGSPAQQNGALAQTVGLLKSKLDELNATYQKGMGPQHNAMELLSPSARKSWATLSQMVVPPAAANAPASKPATSTAPKTIRFEDLP